MGFSCVMDQLCLIFDLKLGQEPKLKSLKGLWLAVHMIHSVPLLPVIIVPVLSVGITDCHYLIDYPHLRRTF